MSTKIRELQSFNSLFLNKVVLITGHSGFKGSWLSLWLSSLGAKIVGISIDVPTNPSNFYSSSVDVLTDSHCVDVRDLKAIKSLVNNIQPDFVFHLAAQSLVKYSYNNPVDTITTNAIGTLNILDALLTLNKKVVSIMITSDKVYDNLESKWGYREIDRIGGKDPYSASKGMAELAIRSYVESFLNRPDSNIRIGIARAGNVIGGGDWSADRIVPDCINSWSTGGSVEVRNPKAIRPWQHVLDPLSGYLVLAENLYKSKEMHGEPYNFGPSSDRSYSVDELIVEMSTYLKNIKYTNTIPFDNHAHESHLLKLSCDKALFDLDWRPALGFKETVEMTAKWYKYYYENKGCNMYDYTINQIEEYTKYANDRGVAWANND
jgi:CDP-glucose 4,6-dehydratase